MSIFETGDDAIVSLSDVRARQGCSKIDRIQEYWTQQRGARLVPARSDIDPRGLDGVLSHAFVLERIAAGLARFRIAGAHMNDIMGSDVRGMPMSAVFMADSRNQLSDSLAAAFDEPAMISFDLVSEAGFGRKKIEGRMLLLPLRSDLGDVTRILGGISMDDPLGRAPRRLTIAKEYRTTLTGYAEPPKPLEDRPGGRVPTPPSPVVASRPNRERTKSELRLVVDNT